MKTAKLLLISSGVLSIVATVFGSTLRHVHTLYVNDPKVGMCTLTIISVTTIPNAQFITVTYASILPTHSSCNQLLTVFKGL